MRKPFQILPALVSLFVALGAHAQANDDWINRKSIDALPFNGSEANMYLATVESTDPDPPCRPVVAGPNPAQYTLWYSYTTAAADEYLTLIAPNNKPVGAIISVYTGNPADGFRIVNGGCAAQSDDDAITRLAGLRLAANTTYSIEVASTFSPLGSNDPLEFSVAAASRYVVTKTADTNDHVCDADCSLREAIDASNAAPGAVVIPAGTYKLTIAGADEYANASGSLDVLHGMGIYGAGMQKTIVDANHLDRAFALDPVASPSTHASFALADLSIINGTPVTGLVHNANGGGLVLASATDYLGLERVALTSNHTPRSGGGAAINSPVLLSECIVSGNVADYFGGGGLSVASDTDRYAGISASTISGNSIADQAGGAGGGVYSFANLRVSNSTISGNHAIGEGGGIYNQGPLHMASSTVVLNTAQTNPNRSDAGAGVIMTANDANSIVDSIIAMNTTANPDAPPDCALTGGSLTSSYNLVGSSGSSCPFGGTGDATGVDPDIASMLAYNGGPTPTHALPFASPAVDGGDPAGCHDAFGALLLTDQRGFGRPEGARCDVGAFEWHDRVFVDGFEP